MVKYIQSINYQPCRGLYQHNLKVNGVKLPQQQYLDNLQKQFNSIATYPAGTQKHELIKLIIPGGKIVWLDELINTIQDAAQQSTKCVYVAVNKFMVFTQTNLNYKSNLEYDAKLISYIADQVSNCLELTDQSSIGTDHGEYGNFVHPVTTMTFYIK